MNTLPEELLDRIFALYVHHPKSPWTYPGQYSLYSVCLVSRKFYRIANPYLYSIISSQSGRMGEKLLSRLKESPQFARMVQTYGVMHGGAGCLKTRNDIGFHEVGYGSVYDECQERCQETLKLLPNLKELDLSRLTTPSYSQVPPVWPKIFRTDALQHETASKYPCPSTYPYEFHFEKLETLSLHMWGVSVTDLWPIFWLGNLRELTLDMRRSGLRPREEDVTRWPISTSPVCNIELVCLTQERVPGLRLLSQACKALTALSISTSKFDIAHDALVRFESQITQAEGLKSLELIVTGLWCYTIEFIDQGNGDAAPLGAESEFQDLLTYVTGCYDGAKNAENVLYESERFRVAGVRELTAEESHVHDARLMRRP